MYVQNRNGYWYLCRTVRINGKPTPKTIHYLGKSLDKLEQLVDQGQLDYDDLSAITTNEPEVKEVIERCLTKLSARQPGFCSFKKGVCDYKLLACSTTEETRKALRKRSERLDARERKLIAKEQDLEQRTKNAVVIDAEIVENGIRKKN
ncbi:MAG: hypothetical protein QXI12_12510 [Candidatus Methanomethyliaceae archaeon]